MDFSVYKSVIVREASDAAGTTGLTRKGESKHSALGTGMATKYLSLHQCKAIIAPFKTGWESA